jgi:UTP-glucose-1-phosphate uridylyltransferase
VTGAAVTRVVIAAGGLGTRVSAWSRYLPKEFYPVAGRPGITHLIDEIAALAPAEAVIVYHPYYEPFAAWARAAFSQRGQDSYHRAARLRGDPPQPGVTLSFIPQRGLYADITSVLNGADHLAPAGEIYVAFADNLYPADNPLLALRAAPHGQVTVLARAYQRELAANRGVIAAIHRDGHLLVSELAEKPDPLAAQLLERRHGTANLFLLEGRARLTPAFISYTRTLHAPAGAEPKLALAIAAWARAHPVVVVPTASHVTDLGDTPRCDCRQQPTARLRSARQPSHCGREVPGRVVRRGPRGLPDWPQMGAASRAVSWTAICMALLAAITGRRYRRGPSVD